MAAYLEPLSEGSPIHLERSVTLVGRGPDCDVILDTSTRISRLHCAVVQVDRVFLLRDLGSLNGIWLGSQRIVREHELSPGDIISIGDLRYRFHHSEQVANRTAAVADTPSGTIQTLPRDEVAPILATAQVQPVQESESPLVVEFEEAADSQPVDIGDSRKTLEQPSHEDLASDEVRLASGNDDVIEIDEADILLVDDVEIIDEDDDLN